MEPLAVTEEGVQAFGGGFLSPLSDEQREALDATLDRDRVKQRQGRGSTKLDYIETHDAIRTANRIFGYGHWGHCIVAQERIGEVEVVNSLDASKKGWHVAYRCVVELTVRGCVPVSGSGYGDGVEYGPAARLTASELALKESESDALKRALKNYGDQFGLILYAKGDDQRRIESDAAAGESASAQPTARFTLTDALQGLEHYVEDGKPWIKEAAEALYEGLTMSKFGDLSQEQQAEVLRRTKGVIDALHALQGEVGQTEVRSAFAVAFGGAEIKGPDPFKPPIPFG